MIKKLFNRCCPLLILVCLMGCSNVYSKHPVGVVIEDDMSDEFDGVWRIDNDIYYTKYIANGGLRIAALDWVKGNFKFQEMDSILTKCDKRNFINLQPLNKDVNNSEEKDSFYGFFYYSLIAEDTVAVWTPTSSVFEEAIVNKEIKGKIEKAMNLAVISIDESSESICNYIKGNDVSKLFDLEDPMIFHRIIESDIKKDKKLKGTVLF